MKPSVPNPKPAIVRTVCVAFPEQFLRRRVLLTLLLLLTLYFCTNAQVTEIITDYNGFWKSTQTSISTIKPDNSHNLVAFKFNGTTYSTGVNDALLTSHGETFVAGDYRALPVHQVSGANTNTKIGLAALYDGVANGPGSPRPANNISMYLTDGANGLNIGTGVANLPAGQIMFSVTNMKLQLVGDGMPDLVITQIADPSGALDSYEFTDVNGNRVGNKVDVSLSALSPLGNWTADFYDASTNPMFLSSGFTQTDRALRLWATDFSTFGINSSNINQIVYFRIRLSGESDMAFVAYNNKAFSLATLLPVTPRNPNTGSTIDPQVNLRVYPNPANQQFTVKHQRTTGNEQLTIRNMQGLVMVQQKPAAGSTQTSFNANLFPKGSYLVTLTNGEKQYTEMLIKN